MIGVSDVTEWSNKKYTEMPIGYGNLMGLCDFIRGGFYVNS